MVPAVTATPGTVRRKIITDQEPLLPFFNVCPRFVIRTSNIRTLCAVLTTLRLLSTIQFVFPESTEFPDAPPAGPDAAVQLQMQGSGAPNAAAAAAVTGICYGVCLGDRLLGH